MSRPTQQDVLLAILAMDAYSRGARGTEKLMETSEDKLSTSVGTATFIRSNVDIPSLSASLSSGFSASEYSLGGGSKVISYRGTDFPQGFRDGEGWSRFILDAAAAAATIFRGITSISLATQAVNATTPSGNRLLDKASFTRTDGATDNVFEAIFQTNALDTVYAGNRGTASWAARASDGAVIDVKGYGRLTALSVALSHAPGLNAVVQAAAAANGNMVVLHTSGIAA